MVLFSTKKGSAIATSGRNLRYFLEIFSFRVKGGI